MLLRYSNELWIEYLVNTLLFLYILMTFFFFFSQTFHEHIKHLELVFQELINNGLVVNIKKIKLFKNQI